MLGSTTMSQVIDWSDGLYITAKDDAQSANDRVVTFGFDSGQLAWVSAPHFAIGESATAYPVEVYAYQTSSPYRLLERSITKANPDGTPDLSAGVPVSIVANVYDGSSGRVTEQVAQSGDKITFSWDDVARMVTSTNAGSGDQVQYLHDDYGHLTSMVDPNGKAATRSWDQPGTFPVPGQVPTATPTETTDRANVNSGVAYDSAGRVAQQVTADPQSGFLPPLDTSDACRRDQSSGLFPAPNTGVCAGKRFAVTAYTYLGADSRVDTATSPAGEITKYVYVGASRTPAAVFGGCGPLGGLVNYVAPDANNPYGRCGSAAGTTGGAPNQDPNAPAIMTVTESTDNRVTATMAGGRVTCFFYNSFGQVTSQGLLLAALTGSP